MQYARLRMPMSMLKTLIGLPPRPSPFHLSAVAALLPEASRQVEGLVTAISEKIRDAKIGLVPLEMIPHLVAMFFNWASFRA
jgi:hypothetical protein